MGNCDECGTKIEYNRFRKVGGEVICLNCYKNRLRGIPPKKETIMTLEQAKAYAAKVENAKNAAT